MSIVESRLTFDSRMTANELLKKLMDDRGLKPLRMSVLMGGEPSRQQIHNHRNGKSKISYDLRHRYADALGITFKQFQDMLGEPIPAEYAAPAPSKPPRVTTPETELVETDEERQARARARTLPITNLEREAIRLRESDPLIASIYHAELSGRLRIAASKRGDSGKRSPAGD